ncbi:tRNA (adenosine(37)-N6)-dimethylallyltransferase MiaA [Trichlorobacter ammonificans]|uniref:tRNA dimethylallyltransferase n=1 Tax=Trichlorobacter ammonificans TaxID=2916410 RepID=A0ABN8HFJ8_9BACT|nr:tRNA (adenosine(37)-N6)-dimethylallyltransferase MiaA [Trichlorobacter ammonificans]CAH2030346.1 tRNA dimethylallyltransferase [Trichlorobacter ammonificans]
MTTGTPSPSLRLLVIAGPTASGKSALALELADRLDGEIVCVDSLTVYRGVDIGSAKPSPTDRARVPHHLLDIRNPCEPFSAADFRREAARAIADITARGKRPILAGGTGLYLRILLGGLADAPGGDRELRERLQRRAEQEGGEALLAELQRIDPETAAGLHPNNLIRIIRALEVWHASGAPLSHFQQRHQFSDRPYRPLQYLLNLPRELLYRRIDARVHRMLREGLVEEYQSLVASGVPADAKPLCAIGYKEVAAFLAGDIPASELPQVIARNTRHYAKRQLTWFRKEAEMLSVAYPPDSATIAREAARFFKEGER